MGLVIFTPFQRIGLGEVFGSSTVESRSLDVVGDNVNCLAKFLSPKGMNLHSHEKGMGAPAPWGTLMYFVISSVGVAHSDLQKEQEKAE